MCKSNQKLTVVCSLNLVLALSFVPAAQAQFAKGPTAQVTQSSNSLIGKPAVVVRNGTEVKQQTTVVGYLRAGEVVRIEQENGAWVWVGRGWVMRNDVQTVSQALETMSHWVRQSKTPENYTARARMLITLGENKYAIRDAHDAVRFGGGAEAFTVRGHCWARSGDPHTAIKDYDEALRLDPKFAEAWLHRGATYSKLDESKKAQVDLDQAIQLDPTNPNAYGLRGIHWIKNREVEKALADFDQSLKLHPRHVLTLCMRGDCWMIQKDYDKAIADFTEANRFDPEHLAGLRQRGQAWEAKHDWDQAINDYNEILKIRPQESLAYGLRGHARQGKGELALALNDYTELIRREPMAASIYRERGKLRLPLGEIRNAVEDLNESLRLQPSDAHALELRGRCRRELGEYEMALKDIESSLLLVPDSATALATRSRIRSDVGWNRGAIDDLDEALKIADDDVESNIAAAWVLATTNDREVRDGFRALQCAERSLKNSQAHQRWDAFDALAAAHAENGQWAEAVKFASRAWQMAPEVHKEAVAKRVKLFKAQQPYRHEPQQLKNHELIPADPRDRQAERDRLRV